MLCRSIAPVLPIDPSLVKQQLEKLSWWDTWQKPNTNWGSLGIIWDQVSAKLPISWLECVIELSALNDPLQGPSQRSAPKTIVYHVMQGIERILFCRWVQEKDFCAQVICLLMNFETLVRALVCLAPPRSSADKNSGELTLLLLFYCMTSDLLWAILSLHSIGVCLITKMFGVSKVWNNAVDWDLAALLRRRRRSRVSVWKMANFEFSVVTLLEAFKGQLDALEAIDETK